MNEKKFINNILQIVQKDNINNNHKRNKNASVVNSPIMSKQMSLLTLDNVKKCHQRTNSKLSSKKRISTSGTKILTIDETSKIQKSDLFNHTHTLTHKKNKSITCNEIKQNLINFFNFKKNLSPSFSTSKMVKYQPVKKKRNNSANSPGALYKNKYSKYNIQQLSYTISNEYSKIEFENKKFIDRMDYYTLKACLKNYTIEELVNENKPKLPESVRVQCFNRLIEDSNRRIETKRKIEGITSDDILMRDIQQSLNNKEIEPMTKKKWNKIYQEKILKRYNDFKQMIEEKRKESLKEKKEKEDKIIAERNKKKKFFSKEKIEDINKRLYYSPHNKKIINCESKKGDVKKSTVKKKKNKHPNLTYRNLSNNIYQVCSYKPMTRVEKAINEFFFKNE